MAKQKQGKEMSMRKIREIYRLSMECGVKNREIARSCSISHTVVNDYLRKARDAGLTLDRIKQMGDEKLKEALRGGDSVRTSVGPQQPDYEYVHGELKKKGVTLELLWQEYIETYAEGFKRSQYYKLYAKWKKKLNVSLRQTHKAGEKMFVDYAGQTVPVIDRKSGEIKEAQIFVAVLGASNYTYAEATLTQGLSDWIGSHIRTFEYVGGVTEIIVPDNLRSGVSKACRYEPDINTTYHELALHYGTAIIPARVRKPKDKAKVEVGVQVVERWILAVLRKRQFFSLFELNEAILELLERLNERPFKRLDGSRLSWFETIEKKALKPLPPFRYEQAEWKKAKVNIDYHVEIDRHYYSVPYRLVHEYVEVRYTGTTVEIFFNSKRIACHCKDNRRGQHTTIKEHMPKSHQEYLEWKPSRIINWARNIGAATASVVDITIKGRMHPEQGYRSCLGILRLTKKYGNERLEAACTRAIAIGGCSYKSIRSILEKGLDKEPLPKEVIEKQIMHKNIRGCKYYH